MFVVVFETRKRGDCELCTSTKLTIKGYEEEERWCQNSLLVC